MNESTSDSWDWAVLARYIAGEASAAERSRVELWLAADPERRTVLDRVRLSLVEAAELAEPADASADCAADDVAWRQLASAMGVERHSAPMPRRIAPFVGAIAAVALVAAVGITLVRHNGRGAWREYATPAGERATVILSDGTRLVLGPASRLRTPLDFGVRARAVDLEGEAYFTVVHDAAHPFSVHTARATVEDIGTQFDVRAYASDHDVRVAVAEGRVDVGNTALAANDEAVIRDAVVAVTHGADVASVTAWTRGTLVFRDTPLSAALADLSRWYGIDIRLGDPRLARLAVTATVGDDAIGPTLDMLVPTLGARYERHGSIVTFYSASR